MGRQAKLYKLLPLSPHPDRL